MNVLWKAVCTAALIAATIIELGCGDVYRPIATPAPIITGNPSGAETEVVLSCCLAPYPTSPNAGSPNYSSIVSGIDVSGDSNAGNKVLNNLVGTQAVPATPTGLPPAPVVATAAPLAYEVPISFDYSRGVVFTANTLTDSVTASSLSPSASGFAATTSTVALEPGSAPLNLSFEYSGATYALDYVVNSGPGTSCPAGTGSLGAIAQSTLLLKATVCLGKQPVFAWIYRDQSKVFVLDQTENQVYVVSATKFEWTHKIPVGTGPIKAAQNNNGQYIYVLNSGSNTISVIDGQAEVVAATIPTNNLLTSSPPIDIAMDTNFNDTTKNTQINHVWILHRDGTVSVWDGSVPGTLSWITSISTITLAQAKQKPPAYPTNLALMRDGTQAYVGIGNTDQIVAIDTGKLAVGAVTPGVNPVGVNTVGGIPATTAVTVGIHRLVTQNVGSVTETLETTTPTVSQIAVSRGGNSADLSKAYAVTTTNTTYNYYDNAGNLTSSASYPNLYNGTSVVTAAAVGTTPINTNVTTILAPNVVTYCLPTDQGYDAAKDCPVMVPTVVLGRS